MTPENIRDAQTDRRSAMVLNLLRDKFGIVNPLDVARCMTAPEGVRIIKIDPWPQNIDKRAADTYFIRHGFRLYMGLLQVGPYSSAYLLEM